MLHAYPLILICLFLSLGSPVEAEEVHPASQQIRAPSVSSPQDLESIFAMADQGDAGSQNYLGFLYATGQNVTKNEKTAFGWFQMAANQGHSEALGNLAMMYEKGLGVEKNMRTAFDLHRQAAMAGYPFSMKRLASLYETGFMGEEGDPIKAEMWKTRYKESLKKSAPATGDATPQQAPRKTNVGAPVEKPVTLKPAASATKTPPQPATTPILGDAQTKPVLSSSSSKANAAATPYFIQIGGKATAQETMEVTQKIIENSLLPQSKKIELDNPDGKNYRINIGPFVDARQAAPYKARIMALLNAAPTHLTGTPSPALPATTLPAKKPYNTPASTLPPTAISPLAALRSAEKPIAEAQIDKSAAKLSVTVTMATAPTISAAVPVSTPGKSASPASTTQAAVVNNGKNHYIEIGGQTTTQETSELMQKIVEKGLLPKNMRVELINTDADNYHIRIGPFANASDAATEIAKINASIITVAPVIGEATTKPIEPIPPAPKIARGQYYFIQINEKSSFEDSMALVKLLLTKELVRETRRVKIEHLDKESFRVSIGPFANPKEAHQQLLEINQKTLQALLVKLVAVSGDGVYRPFIQVNTQGTLDNAATLTKTLIEKGFLPSNMFAEIVNFGAGNFRVRFGPFNDVKEADQNIQNLNKQLKASTILVNLEPLLPVNEK